ncbi:hypothetical protein GW17_00007205 [Ensete ventricosum]|nr:hypothetical protein GW17_00007205 [Ensete ventricosum]
MVEGGEVNVGEVGRGGEGELDHNIISVASEGAREEKVRGNTNEYAQEKEDGPRDYCVSRVKLVNAYPPNKGPKADELVVNGKSCLRRCPTR